MTDFTVTSLDAAGLRRDALESSLQYGRRPQVRGYSNQGFAAGEVGGYNTNWNPIAQHADTEFEFNHQYVLARSYEQHRNNPLCYGPTNVLAECVGELVPTSLAKDPATRRILQEAWSEWCEQAGSDGVSDWSMICRQWVGAAAQGGDVGISYEHRPELGGRISLRVKLHDAYLINSPIDPANDETTRLGVVYKQGVESAYYVAREDAFSLSRSGFYRFDRVRNGRPNFTLFRRPDATRRPGQSRSAPIAATVLNELKDLADYRRAVVRGAAKRARLVQTIKSPSPEDVEKFFRRIRNAEAAGEKDTAAALRESLKPTLVTTPDAATMNIPNYMEVVTTNPDVTDTGYPAYVNSNLKIVAGAWLLPFEVAFQIWEEANYSRAQILAMQKGQTAKIWRKAMTPVATICWRLMVQYLLANEPSLKFSPDLMNVAWHGPNQEYMDIQTEVASEAEGRATGVLSPQEAARRTNRDAFQIEAERLDFVVERKKMLADRSLTEKDVADAFAPVKEKPVAAAPAPTPAPKQKETP